MVAYTQSGYTVLSSYDDPELIGNPLIPDTNGVRVYGGLRKGDPATVLLYVARRWFFEVRHYTQADGVWGFEPRQIVGGSGWSNHAGGVAIDLCSRAFPRGASNMTNAERANARKIISDVNGFAGQTVLDWGGEWSGVTKDEMHTQLTGNVSRTALAVAAQHITKPAPKPTSAYPLPAKWVFGAPGANVGSVGAINAIHGNGDAQAKYRSHIRRIQAKVGATADGYYGPNTASKVRAWQKAHGKGKVSQSGMVGPATWKLMAL